MNWFLYYSGGSCNDGDHTYGFGRFKSEGDARKKIKELVDHYGLWFFHEIILVEGTKRWTEHEVD